MPREPHFSHALFDFLFELDVNNDKVWFDANRERFERDVREPMLAFIADLAAPLAKAAPSFEAIAKKQGGSLFRIHRDTRFSKDKLPYKTWVAAQFRHERGRDVHAPGFYLHLEPGNCQMGAGIWHPDGPTLAGIRTAMVEDPAAWKRARNATIKAGAEFGGDSLTRAPRGFDADHPLIEDIKRKDVVVFSGLDENEVVASDFLDRYVGFVATVKPAVKWVCGAVGVSY